MEGIEHFLLRWGVVGAFIDGFELSISIGLLGARLGESLLSNFMFFLVLFLLSGFFWFFKGKIRN